MIVGFATGGVNDIMARALSGPLSAVLGQTVVVDNRPGANSTIGADLVAKSPPDGYTVFITGTPFTINASAYPKLPYDTLRDFAPVTQLATGTFILVVHPALPVKTVKELIALAKRRPGELNFCSSGQGAAPHLMGELLKLQTGIVMTHVPYKGAGPCVVDLLGGHVQLTFEAMAPLLPHVKAGRLRILAVMSDRKSPVLPRHSHHRAGYRHQGLERRDLVRHRCSSVHPARSDQSPECSACKSRKRTEDAAVAGRPGAGPRDRLSGRSGCLAPK